MLSDYLGALKNTPGDSAVYVLDSGRPGANMLIIAGTHGNEIAGIMAAVMFVEHASAEAGRIIVIPCLNRPGIFAGGKNGGASARLSIQTPRGPRYFPLGTRLVPAEYQGQDDPPAYFAPDSATELPGYEQRNINRAYPGTEEAGLAQKIARAVMNILETENINIAIDLHEAGPASSVAWHIVANPKNADIAALAILDLEEKNITMHIEASPSEMKGLSHREWGDRSNAAAFLVETVNPAQGDNPAPPPDPVHDPAFPLWRRVAVQLEAIRAIAENSKEKLSLPVEYSGLPDYAALEKDGLEPWF
jgi:predicted deacylase